MKRADCCVRRASVIIAFVLLAAPADAQLNQGDSRIVLRPPIESRSNGFAVAADNQRRYLLLKRSAAGAVGWAAGAVGGAYLALVFPHHDCSCDDPGLEEALIGLVVGGTIGGAIGAAVPLAGGRCSYLARFGRGLLGSAVGALIGGVVTIPTYAPASVVVVPITGGTGAALAIGDC